MCIRDRKYITELPEEYHGLVDVVRWFDGDGPHPKFGPDHPAYFYKFRSAQHEHRDLVNRLLAELSPMDFRQLFICHKPLFYKAYTSWDDPKREYVSQFMAEEYVADKEGTRELLYGPWPAHYTPPKDTKKEKRRSSRSRSDRDRKRQRKHDRDDDDRDDDKRKRQDYKNPWGDALIKDGNYYVRQRKRRRRDKDDD